MWTCSERVVSQLCATRVSMVEHFLLSVVVVVNHAGAVAPSDKLNIFSFFSLLRCCVSAQLTVYRGCCNENGNEEEQDMWRSKRARERSTDPAAVTWLQPIDAALSSIFFSFLSFPDKLIAMRKREKGKKTRLGGRKRAKKVRKKGKSVNFILFYFILL